MKAALCYYQDKMQHRCTERSSAEAGGGGGEKKKGRGGWKLDFEMSKA